MRTSRVVFGMCGGIGVTCAVHAGTVSWAVTLSTDDGDAVVEPGESAMIRFVADIDPSTGTFDAEHGGEVIGYGDTVSDLIGTRNWASGRVDWRPSLDLFGWLGDMTVLDDETQNLLNITAVQSDSFTGPFATQDPIWVLDVFWDPQGDYTPRRVDAVMDTRSPFRGGPEATAGIYLVSDFPFRVLYEMPDLPFGFDVVPAPGAAAIMVPIWLVGFRRRERMSR